MPGCGCCCLTHGKAMREPAEGVRQPFSFRLPGTAMTCIRIIVASAASTGRRRSARAARATRTTSTSVRATWVGASAAAATDNLSARYARRICPAHWPQEQAFNASIQAQGGLMQTGWQYQSHPAASRRSCACVVV